ncbi:MAG: hypothetical protein BAA01_13305 [Bacillus thermozeamaize]|uniref:YlaH-like protein n=1 Tax=Bacillus thermozeamaize TaxID=230954 RepID=A0A1Y3PK55_9BACI|nr:MAG: hypothetical protein BAA01_13305 [Bacillus thermozeamaize]
MFEALKAILNTPEKAYFVILVFCFILYKLGFQERKLPLLKAAIVYLVLALGCIPLTTLYMLGLPIAEVLIGGSLAFIIVRWARAKRNAGSERKDEPREPGG